MPQHSNLDDAAAEALLAIALEQSPSFEHLGLLFEQDGSLRRTPTQSRNRRGRTKGRFEIPAGSLRALFHNHPDHGEMKRSTTRLQFSDDDVNQASKLGVPSFISAGDRIRRFNPSTGEASDVLAQFPVELLLEHIAQRNPLVAAILAERDGPQLASK